MAGDKIRTTFGDRGERSSVTETGELNGLESTADTDAPRILVADPLSPAGVERLRRGGEVDGLTGLPADQLVERIGNYDALVVRSETRVTAAVLEAGTRLKVVARAGVGVDNIDVPVVTRHGVIVVNSPEGNTIAAAEHTVAMLLAMSRKIPAAV